MKRRPLLTTEDLSSAIFAAVGGNDPEQVRKHPARRTFQAVRIAVNDELYQLYCALHMSQRLLKPESGRLAILTYHSLEEDIVQRFKLMTSGVLPSNEETTTNGKESWDALLGDMAPSARPIFHFDDLIHTAAGKEQRLNPRARSARLFAARRTSAPPMDFLKT